MAAVRIASGLAIGLAALGLLLVAVGVRDGENWAPPVAGAALAAGAIVATSCSAMSVTPHVSPPASWTGVRVGFAALVGTSLLLVVAMFFVID